MIPIGKTTDLLNALPIVRQLRINKKEVEDKVMRFITKAAMQVGTEVTPDILELMAEDLIDCYKYDSLEDIAEALKKGRQGRYGKIYGKLNGIVLAEWMDKHLSEKAAIREKKLSEYKQDISSEEDIRDSYIKRIEEIEDEPTRAELLRKADRVINKAINKLKK